MNEGIVSIEQKDNIIIVTCNDKLTACEVINRISSEMPDFDLDKINQY